jgi:hypothetical protein
LLIMNLAPLLGKLTKPVGSGVVLGAACLIGIGIDCAPSQAYMRVHMRILATPTDASIEGGSFMNGGVYRFDAGITQRNSFSENTSTRTSWVPTGITTSNSLFNYLTIRTCTNPACTSTSSPGGGGWNPSPSVTDLQEFTVNSTTAGIIPYKPSFNLSFGASSGNTGRTFNIDDMDPALTDVPMSNLTITDLEFASTINWYPAGPTPPRASLTANNIIQNLELALPSGTTGALTPSSGKMVMKFNSTGTEINFNINSVTFESAPGPFPLIGSLVAFSYSRKMRNRIKLVKAGV